MKYVFTLLMILFSGSGQILAGPDSLLYKNLVFEGGGVRGIAYAGALSVLQERGLLRSVERVGGTSVGAITALLVALDYTAADMKTILDNLKIQQFNDGHWFFIGGFQRVVRRYGWYRGKRFERWLETLIARKTGNPNLTFAQLHQHKNNAPGAVYKDLYVTGTDLTDQKTIVFSHQHTPDMSLKTAVRISMSIPLYFGAVFLNDRQEVVRKPQKGQRYHILVDGGLTANYPIELFDTSGRANPKRWASSWNAPNRLAPQAGAMARLPMPSTT